MSFVQELLKTQVIKEIKFFHFSGQCPVLKIITGKKETKEKRDKKKDKKKKRKSVDKELDSENY